MLSLCRGGVDRSLGARSAKASDYSLTELLARVPLDAGSSKPVMVEVLRRCSKDLAVWSNFARTLSHLQKQAQTLTDSPAPPDPPPTAQPYKLSQRLAADTVQVILDEYTSGSTTREVAAAFDLAHSSVSRILAQHGMQGRRRGLSRDEVTLAVQLYQAGQTMQTIAEHLGYGATTIATALKREGVERRPRFSR